MRQWFRRLRSDYRQRSSLDGLFVHQSDKTQLWNLAKVKTSFVTCDLTWSYSDLYLCDRLLINLCFITKKPCFNATSTNTYNKVAINVINGSGLYEVINFFFSACIIDWSLPYLDMVQVLRLVIKKIFLIMYA